MRQCACGDMGGSFWIGLRKSRRLLTIDLWFLRSGKVIRDSRWALLEWRSCNDANIGSLFKISFIHFKVLF